MHAPFGSPCVTSGRRLTPALPTCLCSFSAPSTHEMLERRWRDGSLELDLPTFLLAEMFNCNHFLVRGDCWRGLHDVGCVLSFTAATLLGSPPIRPLPAPCSAC